MIRAKMSLMLFIVLVAVVWVLIPTQYSNAERTKTEVETYSSSSDMDSAPVVNEYQYKREHSESHMSSVPGSEEKKTEAETYRRMDSDSDVAPPAEREHSYEYKREHRKSNQVSSPAVVERDRVIVERDAPAPPREGRLQAWWHRNFHRDTD